jgi:hypothetical protein
MLVVEAAVTIQLVQLLQLAVLAAEVTVEEPYLVQLQFLELLV